MIALILGIISLKINQEHKCRVGMINENNVFISVEFCTCEKFVKEPKVCFYCGKQKSFANDGILRW